MIQTKTICDSTSHSFGGARRLIGPKLPTTHCAVPGNSTNAFRFPAFRCMSSAHAPRDSSLPAQPSSDKFTIHSNRATHSRPGILVTSTGRDTGARPA